MTEAELQQLMSGMSEQQKHLFLSRYNAEKKDPTIALILSILFGTLGIDRFYVGDILAGALKLLTLGGLFIWYIIDFFLIMDRTREYNRRKASEIVDSMSYFPPSTSR